MKDMNRIAKPGLTVLLGSLVFLAGERLEAQYGGGVYQPNPLVRPAVSPYINLLRTGSSPGINYYGIVRPEVAFANSIYKLQGDQNALSGQGPDLASYTALPPTGHAAGFQTQGRYFMRVAAGPVSPSGAASRGNTRPPAGGTGTSGPAMPATGHNTP
jgi:hypothetical protein